MPKQLTNVQFVKKMMEFSAHGALAQVFIIDAITKHAERVAKAKPADIPANGFISGEAWIAVAKEIKAKMDEQYKI